MPRPLGIMKTAIITGAGSGIGLTNAKLLHQAGMAILGVGRDPGKLAGIAAALATEERLATL